jgi:hypothetical protein
MKQHSWRILATISISLVLCCLLTYAFIAGFQPGCPLLRFSFRNVCEFDRTFTVDELLVEPNWLPDSTIVSNTEPTAMRGAIERVSVSIYRSGMLIGAHKIERWTTQILAEQKFETAYGSPGFACGIAPNIHLESHHADQVCAACSVGRNCRAVMQYQDTISILNLNEESDFSDQEFIDLLTKLDAKFVDILEIAD